MEKVLRGIMVADLSGSEMTELLQGRAAIDTYDKMVGATPQQLFAAHSKVALLFPVSSMRQGHWLGLWLDQATQTVHHFDPYGLSPDQEEAYSNVPEGHQHIIQQFAARCHQAGLKFVSNTTRFQRMSTGVNTCGRHVICRLRLSYLSDSSYAALMSRGPLPPDDLVTLLTLIPLNEDQRDSAQIKKLLG